MQEDTDTTTGGRLMQEGHRYHNRESVNARGTQIPQQGVGSYKRTQIPQQGVGSYKRTQIPQQGVG